jgi:hypothetical protein
MQREGAKPAQKKTKNMLAISPDRARTEEKRRIQKPSYKYLHSIHKSIKYCMGTFASIKVVQIEYGDTAYGLYYLVNAQSAATITI